MKKFLKKRAVANIIGVLLASMFTCNTFAAGYDVVSEALFDSCVQDEDGDDCLDYKGIYPTPFRYGKSILHRDIAIMAGFESFYYAKSSFVVNTSGLIIDVGNYNTLGKNGWLLYTADVTDNAEWNQYIGGAIDSYTGIDEHGYIVVENNKKMGLIDHNGNVILPCEYEFLFVENENAFRVTKNYDTTTIDKNKNIIESSELPPVSKDDIQTYEGKYFSPCYGPYAYSPLYKPNLINGIAIVAEHEGENAKVGAVDENDNIIVPFVYDMITPCYDGYAWALKDGKWDVIFINNSTVTVKVNQKSLVFDQNPIVINGRTLVPLRAIFEEIGATVGWDGATSTVTATMGDISISLKIGSDQLYVNGTAKKLDVPATIVNERTLVPARAVSEALNCNVDWDGATNTVLISK